MSSSDRRALLAVSEASGLYSAPDQRFSRASRRPVLRLALMLPAEARIFLEEYATKMLLPSSEAALIRELHGLPGCHTDPLLLQRPRSYAKFVRRALKIGLVTLTRRPLSVLGLFFFCKEEGW